MSYIPERPTREAEEWFHSLEKGKCTQLVNQRLGKQLDQNDAQLPQNIEKNRYTNILPYDSNRVVLRKLENNKYSDYINASYIQVPNCTARYIATQAPLPNTIEDFWRMVFENKSPLIVMLTKEKEGASRKCHRYWPSLAQPLHLTEANLMVECTEEKVHPLSEHIKIGYFNINGYRQETERMATQRVTQIRYEGWPDFGVPKHPSNLLTLLDVYKLELAMQLESAQFQNEDLGPPIIHCSAGVGRTGTFCTLDSALTILKAWTPAKADLVIHIVNAFRQQRVYSVQSFSQFEFIYKVLNYYIKTRPDDYYYY